MAACGFSLNNLSLFGLVLAIGIVVDDAIVVVEAVTHHIEQGMEPKEATLLAMKEVSGPVIATTLILVAVFVPVGFIPGITGSFYQQFAITIAIAVLLSSFNALTLSPALSALLLKPPTGERTFLTPFYQRFNRVFGRGTEAYLSFSSILVRKMARSLLFIVILSGLTVVLVGRIPGGFVPEEDQGYILVNAMLPDASSLERSDEVMKKVALAPAAARTSSTASSRVTRGSVTPIDWLVSMMKWIFTGKSMSSGSVVPKLPLNLRSLPSSGAANMVKPG